MSAAPRTGVPAVLPLALLQALQALDVPRPDDLEEPHGELAAKRLGLNRTVSVEIARLERLTRRGATVPGQEFTALQRLVTRRPDASLVFTDAGRRAARRAGADVGVRRAALRVLPGGVRRAAGFALARRVAARIFGASLRRQHGAPDAELGGGMAVVTEPGPACNFVGAALADLLRQFIGFDGAMVHTTCRVRGGGVCAWSAAAPPQPKERKT
jgi:hypothetical protein